MRKRGVWVILSQRAKGVLLELDVNMLVSTVVYAAVGVLLMGVCFKLVTIVTPFSVRKEIEEDQIDCGTPRESQWGEGEAEEEVLL